MQVTIERAGHADRRLIRELLARNGLPTAGLDDAHVVALVARSGESIVGSAAIELYGASALLRSVAVDAPARGSGLGAKLTRAALDLARDHNVGRVYLLTETADDFFPRFGFRRIDGDEVDPGVRESVEFTGACPASARVMIARI
jgi:amino-acid N-acetyltransferase